MDKPKAKKQQKAVAKRKGTIKGDSIHHFGALPLSLSYLDRYFTTKWSRRAPYCLEGTIVNSKLAGKLASIKYRLLLLVQVHISGIIGFLLISKLCGSDTRRRQKNDDQFFVSSLDAFRRIMANQYGICPTHPQSLVSRFDWLFARHGASLAKFKSSLSFFKYK